MASLTRGEVCLLSTFHYLGLGSGLLSRENDRVLQPLTVVLTCGTLPRRGVIKAHLLAAFPLQQARFSELATHGLASIHLGIAHFFVSPAAHFRVGRNGLSWQHELLLAHHQRLVVFQLLGQDHARLLLEWWVKLNRCLRNGGADVAEPIAMLTHLAAVVMDNHGILGHRDVRLVRTLDQNTVIISFHCALLASGAAPNLSLSILHPLLAGLAEEGGDLRS